jgi:hypothetical protein
MKPLLTFLFLTSQQFLYSQPPTEYSVTYSPVDISLYTAACEHITININPTGLEEPFQDIDIKITLETQDILIFEPSFQIVKTSSGYTCTATSVFDQFTGWPKLKLVFTNTTGTDDIIASYFDKLSSNSTYYKRAECTFKDFNVGPKIISGRLSSLIAQQKIVSSSSSENSIQSVKVNSALEIDVDYTFIGQCAADKIPVLGEAMILMTEGAEITVKSGKTLKIKNNCVKTCDAKRWKSITLEEGAFLIIENSILDNPHIGIDGSNNSIIIANKMNCKNPYIGLKCESCFANISQNSKFNFSQFNPLYPGENLLTNRTYAGIYSNNAKINVVETSFENILNGIRSSDSEISVKSSTFNSIQEYGTNNWSLTSADPQNGKGIHTTGNFNLTKVELNNEFFNCDWAVYTKGVNAEIKSSVMQNVSTGMQFDYSPSCNFDVKENSIDAKSRGINFSWTGEVSKADVTDFNKIKLLEPNSIGIDIVETFGIQKNINHNSIIIGPGIRGINHLNSHKTIVSNNSIFGNSPTSSIGILGSGGSTFMTACNLVSSTYKNANAGIVISEVPNHISLNNDVKGWKFNNWFLGTSLGTYFVSNQIGDSDIGLLMGLDLGLNQFIGARIGVQEHLGNKWLSNNIKGAKHFGSLKDRELSLFKVNAENPNKPYLKPNNFTELVNDGWFLHEDRNEINFTCTSIGSGINEPWKISFPRSDHDIIVNNDFDLNSNYGSRIFTDRRQLYRHLINLDIDTLSTAYQYFYQNYSTLPVGKFEQIDFEIQKLFSREFQKVNEIKLIQSQIQSAYDSIHNICLNLSIRPLQIDEKNQISNLQTTISNLKNFKSLKHYNLTQNINQKLYLLESKNENIVTTNDFEYNQKEVNLLMLKSYMDPIYNFTESEKILIQNIAAQCPYYGGEGVYRARALASKFMLHFIDDSIACSQTSYGRTISKTQNITIDINLYPNPTGEILYLTLPNTDKINFIHIYDIQGHLKLIPTDLTTPRLNLKNLEAGMYIIEIILKDNTTFRKKLIKS